MNSPYFLHSGIIAPHPPAKLIEDSLASIQHAKKNRIDKSLLLSTMTNTNHEYDIELVKNGVEYKISKIEAITLNDPWLSWAKMHISQFVTKVTCTFTYPDRPYSAIHTDRTRAYGLLYVLDNGGHNNRTVFYKEKACNEIIRPLGTRIFNFDLVEELASLQLPVNQWTLLNPNILHSVENIEFGRNLIQLDFDVFPTDIQLDNPIYLEYPT